MFVDTSPSQGSDFFSCVMLREKLEEADLSEPYRLIKQWQLINLFLKNLFFNSLLNF